MEGGESRFGFCSACSFPIRLSGTVHPLKYLQHIQDLLFSDVRALLLFPDTGDKMPKFVQIPSRRRDIDARRYLDLILDIIGHRLLMIRVGCQCSPFTDDDRVLEIHL